MLVESALVDADDAARQAASEALRWSAGDPGTADLLDALDANEPMRRARAARALGVLQDDCAASTLAEALEREDDPPTRLEIAASLVELRADGPLAAATHMLVDLVLSEEDVALRRSAREVLDRWQGAGHDYPVFEQLDALADSGSDDELERALGLYLDCLDKGLDSVICLWMRGNVRARRGLYEEALSDYDTVVKHGGINAIHRDRASALASLARHEDALTAQRLAVEGEPDDAVNHALLGRYAYEAGDYDLSIASRLKALELARSLPDDERHAVADEVRRDLDALRAQRPEPIATVDLQLRSVSETTSGSGS